MTPFHYSTSVGEQFHFEEVRDNILIFIPFGVLLSMLSSRMKLQNKVLIIFGSSFILEMIQYILAIGSTDITDLITNMFGGIIGIGLYALLLKILKDKQNRYSNFNSSWNLCSSFSTDDSSSVIQLINV